MNNLAAVERALDASPADCTVVRLPRVLGVDIDHRPAHISLFFSEVDGRVRFHAYVSQPDKAPIHGGGDFAPAATPIAVAWLLDGLGISYSPKFPTVLDAVVAMTAYIADSGIQFDDDEMDDLLEALITITEPGVVTVPLRQECIDIVARHCEAAHV